MNTENCDKTLWKDDTFIKYTIPIFIASLLVITYIAKYELTENQEGYFYHGSDEEIETLKIPTALGPDQKAEWLNEKIPTFTAGTDYPRITII